MSNNTAEKGLPALVACGGGKTVDQKAYRKQILISLALIGFSLFYFLSSLHLKMGTPRNMGPGFVPAMLGVLLLVSTGFHLIRVYRARPSEEEIESSPKKTKNYWAVAGILASTAAYPLILETVKFIAATFLVGFFMLLLWKPRKFFLSFLFSLGMAVGCFFLFSRFFGVALPSGFLETLLFRIGA